MGIDTTLWRARIGLFSQPSRSKSRMSYLMINGRTISLTLRLFLMMSLLICGDIESNPGPWPRQQNLNRYTRQTSQYFNESQNDTATANSSGNLDSSHTPMNTDMNQEKMFEFLQNMKEELSAQS